MRSRGLDIGSRLTLGFTILMLITVLMGAFALFGMDRQAGVTEALYRHPLAVSNAVRDIQSAVVEMDRNMKDVVLDADPATVADVASRVDELERVALTNYDLIEERFLGDRSNVELARRAFIEWRETRRRIFADVERGALREAVILTRGSSAGEVAAIQVLNQVMSDFASAKADAFFAQARTDNRQAILHTVFLFVLLVLAGGFIATLVARSITGPLRIVDQGIAKLATGSLDHRIVLDRRDEVGRLARNINGMADALAHSTASLEALNLQIKAREAAEKHVAGLGRIIENSLSEFSFLDCDTFRFIEANRGSRENLGYSLEELRTMTPADLSGNPDAFVDRLTPLLTDQEQRLRFTTTIRRKDGTTYPADIDLQRAELGGRPVLVAQAVDTTELRAYEQEKHQLELQVQHTQKLESLGVLAGGIAHDFNNILMIILGNSAIALEDLPVSSPVRSQIVDIETASKRAAELCRQMLAYSGKGKFETRNLDISRVVEEIGHMLEISVSKSVVLKYDLGEGLPPLHADATQIGQVILNLITNASEALGERNGVVSIVTSAQHCDEEYLSRISPHQQLAAGYYVTLEVSDTGCGMSQAVRQRMFEPFFTTKFTGRGLGMAAVLGIIRGHKGAINVYSEEGRGTTIKVLLPMSDTASALIDDATHDLHHVATGSMALLVDDEETVRTLGRLMLERMGYEVLLAVDGEQGVDLFAQHADQIAFVLLDLTMPHMDGREAFRAMKRIRDDVPIILSSGYNSQDVTQQFAGRRLSGFIQKPYQPQDLARKLNEVLGSLPSDAARPGHQPEQPNGHPTGSNS